MLLFNHSIGFLCMSSPKFCNVDYLFSGKYFATSLLDTLKCIILNHTYSFLNFLNHGIYA